MQGFLYLLLSCCFCFGWSAGTASRLSQNLPSNFPSATAIAAPDAIPARPHSAAGKPSSGWQPFDDTTHGLTIFYPPGWLFFDAAQDLTLPEEIDGAARGKMMAQLMRLQAAAQSDSVVGFGFALPQEPPDLLHINNVSVDIFPSKGLTLYQFGQIAATQLRRRVGIEVDSFDLVTRLRPRREEAISIRFRGGVPAPASSRAVLTGARTAGWQVVLLSTDSEFALVLTFTVLGEQFDELEPLLTEMVRRVQWANGGPRPEPALGPVTISNRTMQVHAEPAAFSPVIGKVVAGEQFSVSKQDSTGNWWRISYDGQPGWVSDHLVAANVPNAPVAVPVAMIERRVNVRSGPGASNPVIGVAIPGQQYLITGKSAGGDWWQIDDGDRPGWVFGDLVTAVDAGGVKVAVVKFPAPPLLPVTAAVMMVNHVMNVRGGPDTSYPVIGAAIPGRQYPITGRNAAGDWWRIEDNGQPGWVFGGLATLANAGSVQVVARFPLPPLLPATEAVVTFSHHMNVYAGPGGRFPVIDTTVPGYQYSIIGRNVVGSWWQIDNQGQPGWVFGQFVTTVREPEEGR